MADATAPDSDVLEQIGRDIQRRRGPSKVDLTERDIVESRMNTHELLLDALSDLAAEGAPGTRATRREAADDDADGDGRHTLRKNDLARAIADLLDARPGQVHDRFDQLRDDADDTDTDDMDDLAEAVADMIGVSVADVRDALADLNGDTDTDDGTAERSKSTVSKSMEWSHVGSDDAGRAALVLTNGDTVPLDALAAR